MKNFKGMVTFILFISLLYPWQTVQARELYSFNKSDIDILEEVYNTENNSNLLTWDLSNPLSIENVGWGLFEGEYNIISLDLSNIEITGVIDLTDCENLMSYNFSNTLIKSIILPSKSLSVPEKAFENCSNLISVIINNPATSIESYAFSGCVSLKCVSNAENIKSIGRNAFNNCIELAFYSNGISDTYISDYAVAYGFKYCNLNKTDTYGYAGIMSYPNEQRINLLKKRVPYRVGTVCLYDEDGNLIDQVPTDVSGRFDFSNLSIGHSYRLIIDGLSAFPRTVNFIVDSNNYSICEEDNAFGVAICDYCKDGNMNFADTAYYQQHIGISITEDNFEDCIYDLNCDNYVDELDTYIYCVFLSSRGPSYADY